MAQGVATKTLVSRSAMETAPRVAEPPSLPPPTAPERVILAEVVNRMRF